MPPSGQDHVLHALVHMPDQKGSDGRWLIQKLESPQGLNTKKAGRTGQRTTHIIGRGDELPAPMHASNIQRAGNEREGKHETKNNWNHEPLQRHLKKQSPQIVNAPRPQYTIVQTSCYVSYVPELLKDIIL
jgi:hypothetical protein